MFLITTADQRFWKTDEKILFLGEWCKIYNQKDDWLSLDYEVLPYHWDDREKLYRDYLCLDRLYEKYLILLTDKLNCLHKVDYSTRYWRIVIGIWLFYFIEILFDRYLSIKSATECRLITDTWISPKNKTNCTPKDIEEFIRISKTDEYNHYLYSRIIETLGQIPFHVLNIDSFTLSDDLSDKNDVSHLDFIFTFVNQNILNRVPSRWNDIIFISSYLDIFDIIKLQISLKQFPRLPLASISSENVSVQESMRKQLILKGGQNEFESILDWIIAEQMPKAYIEDYTNVNKKSFAILPKKPKIIFTANAYQNKYFQVWSAFHVEHGAKLIGTQHGGHYGSGLWSASESHQISICDKYYTWGWELNGNKDVIPFSTGKFQRIKKIIAPNPKGTILMVGMSILPYSHWMWSNWVGPQFLNYLSEQYSFVQSLSPEAKKVLLLRLDPQDYSWNKSIRWKDQFPKIQQYQGKRSFYKQLNESRLFIGTYNATTYLEAFSVNFPTILFWNPKYNELRPSAKPYFDELRRVGILHDTPKSAAEKVNEVFKDPQSWWDQTEIQEAVADFSDHFLRTSKGWLKEWKHEFKDILQSINYE